MSELKLISPLLDGMAIIAELSSHNGRTCYSVQHARTGERFVLKHISIPASDKQVQALLLTGAYPDEAAVHTYYGTVAEDIKRELDAGKRLAESDYFVPAISCQVEPKESGAGYDLYILYQQLVPLSRFIAESAMTGLRAVNLGIDICSALEVCRESGYLFGNLKPENVFLSPSGRFLLGDLGLVSMQDLQYASVPEEYLGAYAAPELSDIAASPNTTMDLYALGMLLYRIYNGNHGPFEDEHTGEGMADKLRLTGKALPTPIYADYELASIILKACSPAVEERYQTPEEFKQALVYYMQRNELSDTLIVPPIVSSPILESFDEEEEEISEPIRFTDAEMLDEDFRRSFAPDLSGAGTEDDIEIIPEKPAPQPKRHTVVAVPVEENEESAEEAEEPIGETAPVDETPASEPETTEEIEAEEADLAEEEEANPSDPEQVDLDDFLASITNAIDEDSHIVDDEDGEEEEPSEESEEDTQPIEEPVTYIDAEADDEEPAEKKRKLPVIVALAIVFGILLILVAAVYLLITWHFVSVDGLEVTNMTTERFSLIVNTEEKPAHYSVVCTDQHGNAYPVDAEGNVYTFTGLTENSLYTVNITAAEKHRLTSASVSEFYVTTPESTEILTFEAALGETDGEAMLSLTYEGPAPVQWKLTYLNTAGKSETVYFTGSAIKLSNLPLNDTYTFTLENTENIFLSGAVSTSIEVIPIVKASNFAVTEISGTSMTLNWNVGENLPKTWTVTCDANGFNSVDETVVGTSYTLQVPDYKRDYTFTLSAEGMIEPLVLVLPANPIVVSDLKATADAEGTANISWETVSGSPAGGWYVTFGHPKSNQEPTLREADGTSITLTGLIPNSTYVATLQPADGSNVFGSTQVTIDVPGTDLFGSYGVSADNTYISLWKKPSGSDWNYRSLSTRKSTFSTEEGIAVCLQANNRSKSDDEIQILYVVRDKDGNVVADATSRTSWNSMWQSLRHTSAIPNPGVSGDYTLEIYVNRQLLKRIGFTIA